MEQSREKRTFPWIDSLLRDFRFATRLVRRYRLFTAAAVAIVALAVGANTAIVSVLETVLLNPLGLRQAGQVMVATVRLDKLQMHGASTSGVEVRELQSMTDAFSAVAAIEGRAWTSEVNGEPVRLLGRAVTPEFFQVFREQPLAGRFFAPEDQHGVVLSYRFWKAQFGGDLSVIGRPILLDGQPHRVIGVAGAGFQYPANAQLWTPLVLAPDRLRRRGYNMNLAVFARLRDDVTPAQAADRVKRYVAALKSADSGEAHELAKLGYFIDLGSFAHYVAGDFRRPLWLLWAAALLVLLTGCANIAALLLSRTAGRRREMAVRLSLGATGFQIVRQLLVEALLLAALGGACGIAVAQIGVSALTGLTIPGKPMLELVRLDHRLMLYGLGLALASGLLFGLAPAAQLLRDSQTSAMARGARRRFQDAFVTAEVAAAFVLVAGTGLLLRSLWALEQVHPGFNPSGVSTAFFIKPKNDPGFLGRLESTLGSSAGVESAAVAYPVPFSGGGLTSSFSIQGRRQQPGEPEWHGEAYFVSPAYFRTLRIPLVRGRGVADSDTATSALVCVIDTQLAGRFFPNEDPIGHEIAMYKGDARIVGVVAPIHGTTLEQASRPTVYYPIAQVPFFPQAAALVRSKAPGGPIIRQAMRQTNASVPVYDIRSMQDRIAESFGIRRSLALLVCAFAAICLLLAMAGLHGVVAEIVGERTPEIGIRMALGARPGQILARFLGRGMLAGAIGVLIGLAASIYAQRWLAGFLFGVKPLDAATFCFAGAGVMVAAVLAVLWPARAAMRVDPQVVLRYE